MPCTKTGVTRYYELLEPLDKGHTIKELVVCTCPNARDVWTERNYLAVFDSWA